MDWVWDNFIARNRAFGGDRKIFGDPFGNPFGNQGENLGLMGFIADLDVNAKLVNISPISRVYRWDIELVHGNYETNYN